ncbi:FLYWCH-type domain-containing protein [Aphis craccivora]|uniref:FLYWCH-type domain-containing protein n=1 Tax=Aphis craccivora TaxID=307492 RepID=A0A6G0ZLA5_APHCR|nr:FLYWCH-type domain-containing protein [Aphis craccivora]
MTNINKKKYNIEKHRLRDAAYCLRLDLVTKIPVYSSVKTTLNCIRRKLLENSLDPKLLELRENIIILSDSEFVYIQLKVDKLLLIEKLVLEVQSFSLANKNKYDASIRICFALAHISIDNIAVILIADEVIKKSNYFKRSMKFSFNRA